MNIRKPDTSRKHMVCIKNKCFQCHVLCSDVPENCEFGVLHVLAEESEGIRIMERGSGKTTKLIRMANEVIENGRDVAFVVCNSHIKNLIRFELSRGVRVLVMDDVKRCGRLAGLRLYVICDEISPDDLKIVKREMNYESHLLAAFSSLI